MNKILSVIVGVSVLVVGVLVYTSLNNQSVITVDRPIGAVVGPDYYEAFRFHSAVSGKDLVITPTLGFTATTTLHHVQSGAMVMQATSTGIKVELPAVTNKGSKFKFIVGATFATNNFIVESMEGDNIEGALIVAGAVVDCDAEDQINFVADGENLGDFVELYSDGTSWHIGASGGLTSAKITCTDPV